MDIGKFGLQDKEDICMDRKLKYERYKELNNIITIDLHNDFSVIAIISSNKSRIYNVELRLKGNTFERWDLIGDADNLIFKTTHDKIYSAILKKVSMLLDEGFFNHYIERYNYEMRCFDIGDELVEKERLSGINVS